MLRLVPSAILLLLLMTMPVGAGGAEDLIPRSPIVLYGWGTLDPSSPEGIEAIELPSGVLVGHASVGGLTQGGAFALAPDGRHAFLLDREQEAPSLKVLRRATVPDAMPLLGMGRVVAVAVDGRQVYVETMRIVGPNRLDPVLRVGQPDSAYGIAVYDVARGAFTREIRLDPPWCGVADLYARPDGTLMAYCYTSSDARLIDPARGAQVARIGVSGVGSVVSPDGQRLLTVSASGTLYDVDLTRMTVAHETELGPGDGGGWVPFQELHLTADGKRLFVRASPGDAELQAEGNGTVVWIVDTESLRQIATVPLPAPAFHLAPTPDGRMLVATTNNVTDHSLFGTRVVDVPSGRLLCYWPGVLGAPQVR